MIFCACLVFVCAAVPAIASPDLDDIEIESSNVHENEWKSDVELAADGSFRLLWKTSEHRIIFVAEVRTHGYFELGFSLDGRVDDADIVVGWVNDATKKPYLVVSNASSSLYLY